MTTVYNKCSKCDDWVIEREMDYFATIGLVCQICKSNLLDKNIVKSIKRDLKEAEE